MQCTMQFQKLIVMEHEMYNVVSQIDCTIEHAMYITVSKKKNENFHKHSMYY